MIRHTDTQLPVVQQLMLLGVILLLIFSSGLPTTWLTAKDETPPVATTDLTTVSDQAHATQDQTAFTDVSITGTAAYVWDVTNQRALYQKNEDQQLPLASLTKLMTALVAHEILAEDENVPIEQTALRQDGASGLAEGEVFDRIALSDLMLVSSSNDGAYAIASAAGAVLSRTNPANAFVQAMNIRAQELGSQSTYYKNPTGLDISPNEGGAYGTAKDMASLMEYILTHEPSILARTEDPTLGVANVAGYEHEVENTNFYLDEIPGLIGSKTGYTDLAGGNLVVAFNAGLNRPFIIVVLGSTRQDRFNDVIALADEVQLYLTNQE